MKEFFRILLASLVAPLAVPLLIVLFWVVAWLISNNIPEPGTLFIYMGFFSAFVCYGFMFLLFLPVLLLMRMRGWTSRMHQSLSGLVCGVLFGFLLSLWARSVELAINTHPATAIQSVMDTLLFMPFYGACGYLMGWIFWSLTNATRKK